MDNYKFYKSCSTPTLENLLLCWRCCLDEDKIQAIERVLEERKND